MTQVERFTRVTFTENTWVSSVVLIPFCYLVGEGEMSTLGYGAVQALDTQPRAEEMATLSYTHRDAEHGLCEW